MKKIKSFYLNIMVTLVILGLFLAFFTYLFQQESETKVLNTLTEISEQSVRIIENEVDSNKKLLENLSILLSEQDVKDPLQLVEMLNPVDQANGFKRMGVVFDDRHAYGTTGEMIILNDEQGVRFVKSMDGETTISDKSNDFIDQEDVTVYSTPIHFKDGTKCVLFGTYSIEYYRDILSVTSFEGNGYTYVIKQNGDLVVSSRNKNTVNFSNFFTENGSISKTDEQEMIDLQKKIEQGEHGIIQYGHGDAKRYLYYQPLTINDWYLLSEIPVSVVEERVNGMLFLAYGLMASCVLALAYLAIRIIKMNDKHHRDIDRMLFVDEVTGYDSSIKFNIDVKTILDKDKDGYAIVCFNIRKFQYINDLYGFEEGNRVLNKVMHIIVDNLKSKEKAARFQSDQFVTLLRYENKQQLHERVLDILNKIQEHTDNRHSELPYQVTLLSGIYLVEEDDDISVQTMIDRANTALRSSYDSMNSCVFYNETIRKQLLYNKEIEDSFEDALLNGEFKVFIQPKFNVDKQGFYGGEALVRWQKADVIWQTPADFIPILEKSGQIIELDEFIFSEVCRKIKNWLEVGYDVSPISVNVSMLHLYRMDFVDNYMEIIEKHGIPANLVELEMTETALFNNTAELINILGQFRDAGVSILMDDFGSGYSSVNLLQNMPIDILKIDKCLVDDVVENIKGKRILEITVALAHSLDLKVVAEGVETQEQFEIVREIKVDYVQGFYCARPMPIHEYEQRYLLGDQ